MKKIFELLILFPVISLATNKIHTGGYQFFLQHFQKNRSELQAGIHSPLDGAFMASVSGIKAISPRFEWGGKFIMDTEGQDFSADNVKYFFNTGLRTPIGGGSAIQFDLIFDGDMNLSAMLDYSVYSRIWDGFNILSYGRTGFGRYFGGKNMITQFEFGFQPRYRIIKPVILVAGISWSSEIPDLKDASALDFSPGVFWILSNGWTLVTHVDMGIAGAKSQDDWMWNLGVQVGF